MTSIIQTIGRGMAFQSFSNIASRVVGLVVIFVILRNLSVYEYGLTELVMSLPALLSIFALPGIGSTIVADLGLLRSQGNDAEAARLQTNFFRLQLLLSLIPFLVVFFGAELIAHFYNEGIAEMVRIVSFLFLIGPFRSRMVIVNQVFRRFRTIAAYSVTEEAIKLVVVLSGILLFDMGGKAVILSYVLCESLPILLYHRHYRATTLPWRGIAVAWRWDEIISPLRAHALWGIATSYLNTFSNNIRLWCIKFLLGTEAVGLFGVAMGMYQHTVSLLPLSSIISPLLSQYQENKLQFLRLINKGIKYQVAGFLLSGVLGIIGFYYVFPMLFPVFTSAYPLYAMFVPTLLWAGVAVIFTPVFAAIREQKRLFQATLVKTVAITALSFPMMSLFGIAGVAIEFFLTNAIFVLERYRVLRRLLPGFHIEPGSFFHLDSDDRLILDKVKIPFMKYFSKKPL